jgi:uncharacterized protein
MTEQVAVFTYGRPVAISVLKERLASIFQRFAIVLFLFFILVYTPWYFIGYLLYLVLSAPAIEIAITLATKARLLPAEGVCRAGDRLVRLGCQLFVPLVIVFAGGFNNTHPMVKEIAIELPRKSSAIKELDMVFASDFHLDPFRLDPVSKQVLDRFVAKANALHPDIILIGGDILDEYGRARKHPTLANLENLKWRFRRLHARYGVYAIQGNHGTVETMHELSAGSGMKLLEDSVEKIDNAFYLAGFEDGRKLKETLSKEAPENLPVILLKHIPSNLERISRSRVDLQLSGHTHNGQVFPANLLVEPIEYELAHGAKLKRNTLFIVSSGLHFGDFPINTVAFSEILHIKAVFRSDIRTPRLGP